MQPYSVLIRPILSEKSNEIREGSSEEGSAAKYIFEVATAANKGDIARAVERMYNVKVTGVTTLIKRGKVRRRGAHVYQVSDQKRAFITLAKGAKIPVFEEA